MLTHVELRLGLVVLQIVVLQLRFFPVYRQNFVIKICIIVRLTNRNILNKVAQILPDMLKFTDSGSLHIICVQDLVDQFRLHHDFRNICHRRDGGDLFKQITPRLAVLLSRQVRKLDAV